MNPDLPQLPLRPGFILHDLRKKYGYMVSGRDLWTLLGYRSGEAMRVARLRGQVPVSIFEIPHRRGKFARVDDVAAWLERVQQNMQGEKT